MMPAGRGWAKNSGLFDEEELAQIQGVDAEPLPPTGSVTTIRGPAGTQDTVLVRGLDVSAPAPRAPLRASVQPAPEVAEAPPSKTAALTGLTDEDLRAAMRSDSKRRLIDSIVNAGAMATAGLSNRDYTPIASGKYNQEDKVRAQLASAADFDLRKSGAEAKAQHWQELAEARAGQLGLNTDKLKAMIEAKDKEEAGKNRRADTQRDTTKEVADMKTQAAAKLAEEERLNKLKLQGMKGKGKGGGAGTPLLDSFGWGANEEVAPKPGYKPVDAPTKRLIGVQIDASKNISREMARIKELTRRALQYPVESLTDGTKAALASAVNNAVPLLNTAQKQGVVNAGDMPRALTTMAQDQGVTLKGIVDRLGAWTKEDKDYIGTFSAGLDETDRYFKDSLNTALDTYNYQIQPRKGATAGVPEAAKQGEVKPTATVTVRRKSDGKTKTLTLAEAEKILADPKYEKVPK